MSEAKDTKLFQGQAEISIATTDKIVGRNSFIEDYRTVCSYIIH